MKKWLDSAHPLQNRRGLTFTESHRADETIKEENSSYGGGHLMRCVKKRLRYLPTILAVCCVSRKD